MGNDKKKEDYVPIHELDEDEASRRWRMLAGVDNYGCRSDAADRPSVVPDGPDWVSSTWQAGPEYEPAARVADVVTIQEQLDTDIYAGEKDDLGFMNPRLLSVALLGKDVVKVDPEAAFACLNDELAKAKRTDLLYQQLAVAERGHADIMKDCAAGKKIAASLLKHAKQRMLDAIEEHRRYEAWMLADSESRIRFVPLDDDDDPVTIANRVLKEKERYPDCEVTPVYVKPALDDVEPQTENFIDDIKPFMTLSTPVENFPKEIMFSIPDEKIPFTDVEGFMPEMPNVEFKLTRYVHVDSMPKELQDVVNAYLLLRHSDDQGFSHSELLDVFKKSTSELHDSAGMMGSWKEKKVV